MRLKEMLQEQAALAPLRAEKLILEAFFRRFSLATLVMCVASVVTAAEPSEPSNPAEATHRIHMVQSGESLSEIAYTYYSALSNFRLIQWANRLPDADHIGIGDELVIPSASFFLQPHGLADSSASLFHRTHSKTGELFVGIYYCRTADESSGDAGPLSTCNFVVTRLGRNDQNDLVFDLADFSEEMWFGVGGGEFEFIDLDGDGDLDILGEWSQGSANLTTHIAFHYQKGSYRAHKIQSLNLGYFNMRRGPGGVLQFIYYPRYEDEAIVVRWDPAPPGRAVEP